MDIKTKAITAKPDAFQGTPAVGSNPGWVRRNTGVKVEEGQNWHHLTHQQRLQWAKDHENYWKTRYSAKMGDLQPNMNWSRG